jgi:hypothetical protein
MYQPSYLDTTQHNTTQHNTTQHTIIISTLLPLAKRNNHHFANIIMP